MCFHASLKMQRCLLKAIIKVHMCGSSGHSLLAKCKRADHYHKARMSESRHDVSGDPLVCYFLCHILICTVK